MRKALQPGGELAPVRTHGDNTPQPIRSLRDWLDHLAARDRLDLSRCSAYSDSINDMPLLCLVGRPVAVNPDSALRAEAKWTGVDAKPA